MKKQERLRLPRGLRWKSDSRAGDAMGQISLELHNYYDGRRYAWMDEKGDAIRGVLQIQELFRRIVEFLRRIMKKRELFLYCPFRL